MAQEVNVATIRATYSRHTGRKALLVAVLLGLTGATALVATAVGAAGISVADVWRVVLAHLGIKVTPASDLAQTVVWEIRLPRILLAVIAGMALGGAGAVMQGVLRNPLVSPYTMGLSSGAAFGAALAIVLGTGLVGGNYLDVSRWLIVTNAFIFGGLTTLFAFSLARFKGMSPEILVLGGVAIGYLFQAGVSLLKYISNNDALKELVVWLMGGFWGANWQTVGLLAPVVLGCMAGLLLYAWDLNVLGAGEEVAASLGIKVGWLRVYTLTLATLAAAATVAFTGIIGFVCLVGPHICRMLVGSDNRFLIPCSCLMGAVLLLLADTLARTIIAPTELPVGIITALMGSPFFIYLLIKKRRQWWG
ncbi:transport system permease protein [Candidatus Desulforudis audaxviator MP104C]|uniref:Transport system permease protein n=1 Tax=Desulforudis audaxviator (strain MP104C) TaxID=477974 RepID=B1I3U2_DESAP|nr:iron ABC transporter permease [Candidatus Desulforudis audaxviator]ACA59728.1 transport system permease protein [Candidatus Desulforudis audaxviator MP104C]